MIPITTHQQLIAHADDKRADDGHLYLVALSGGKDSTAMALRHRELRPDQPVLYFCTPTGDELPDMQRHWALLERLLGQPLLAVNAKDKKTDGPLSLVELCEQQQALPTWRMRWCTRVLKIEPALWMSKALAEADFWPVMLVGLRADEQERRGIYGDGVDVEVQFPMRQWGWGIGDVKRYLGKVGVVVPRRTDCACCFAQRLSEWFDLWERHRERYEFWAAFEERIGHTLRSAGRDTWPAALAELAVEFQRCADGEKHLPRGVTRQVGLFGEDPLEGPCRVCRL